MWYSKVSSAAVDLVSNFSKGSIVLFVSRFVYDGNDEYVCIKWKKLIYFCVLDLTYLFYLSFLLILNEKSALISSTNIYDDDKTTNNNNNNDNGDNEDELEVIENNYNNNNNKKGKKRKPQRS